MNKLPTKKLPVKIIALDLDDTLLKKDLTISDKNVAVLQRAAAVGIYVVICSGRTENAILPYVRRLDIAGLQAGRYIIASNGASVYDLHERHQIYSRLVDEDVLLHANEEAGKLGLYSEVYDASTIYVPQDNKWTRLDVNLSRLEMQVVPNFVEFLKRGHPKMVIPGEPEVLQKLQVTLKKDFGARAVVFTSKPYFLEVLPANCGKGEALMWLSNRLEIPQTNTMGFGDSMNDESMIRLSKYGIGMCNGLEYIQQVAAYVTEKNNEEDGVADFIEKYVL
jgi:Cof subfamily protein (haloacid dehalogenase superfamily)